MERKFRPIGGLATEPVLDEIEGSNTLPYLAEVSGGIVQGFAAFQQGWLLMDLGSPSTRALLYHIFELEDLILQGFLHKNCSAHLSKCNCNFKQKCTQLMTPLSGTVFYALSHGMICFVPSVSHRNRFLSGGFL